MKTEKYIKDIIRVIDFAATDLVGQEFNLKQSRDLLLLVASCQEQLVFLSKKILSRTK